MVYEKEEDNNLTEVMSAYRSKKSDVTDTAKKMKEIVPDLRDRVAAVTDAYGGDLLGAEAAIDLLSACIGGIAGFKAKAIRDGRDLSASIEYNLGRVPVDISDWDEQKLASWLKTLRAMGISIEAHLGKGCSSKDYSTGFKKWLAEAS